jgi:hypothetical protein
MALNPSSHPLSGNDLIGFIEDNQGGDSRKSVRIFETIHITIEGQRIGVPEEGSEVVSTVFSRSEVWKRPRNRRGEMQRGECVENPSK